MSVATPNGPPSPTAISDPHAAGAPAVPDAPYSSGASLWAVSSYDVTLYKRWTDLSEEEAELEDNTLEVKNRGYGFLVPIGKMLTQARREELTCADEGSEVDESARSSHPESPTDDGEGDGDGDVDGTADGEDEGEEDEDGGMDLDAEIEDMDDDLANTTAETEDLDDVDDIDAGVLDE
ncbi:hypothetical protein H4582DRAFT_2093900 [Lactarius indigo]|nr:hypothetical protein H4582DRAFT_2093900 [Lactarius indigo]